MTAEPASSKVLLGAQIPEAPGAPVLLAHGEADDHLRWTVLLAQYVLDASSGGVHLREAAETCKGAQGVSWPQRLDALTYLLHRAPAPDRRQHHAVLVDVDALDTGPIAPEDLWDDRDFRRQRGEFFDVLLEAIGRGGWLVVRTNPSSDSLQPDKLALLGSIESEASSSTPQAIDVLGAEMRGLPPECHPVLHWLVQSGSLRSRDVSRLFSAGGPDGFERDILATAFEAIPSYARKAGKQLAAIRSPQQVNGMLGPFRLFGGADSDGVEVVSGTPSSLGGSALMLEVRAVQRLRECGFLQPGPQRNGHPTLRMPRAVRSYLLPLAVLGAPDVIEGQHQALGQRSLDSLPLDEQLETHFHAIHGGTLDDAVRTARYYGTDLRGLAFRRSREERYQEAADVYQSLVDKFDPKDAYAWEYLAYNLALASGPGLLTEERAQEIRSAYVNAYELDRENPLYHGRLLGFRAHLGEDVRMEFHRGMRRYISNHGEESRAISFFAEPVLRGMMRGRWGNILFDAVERWRGVLVRHSQLRPLLREQR